MSQSQTKVRAEGAYLPQARRVVAAQFLKAKAAEEELNAKRACAKAMQAVSVRDFVFTTDHGKFRAVLTRPEVERVSPAKLYTLVKEGEISLDDFLECVKADTTMVEELVGKQRLPAVMETHKKGLDLIITYA